MSAALISSCAAPCAAKVSRRSVQASMGSPAGLQRPSISLRHVLLSFITEIRHAIGSSPA